MFRIKIRLINSLVAEVIVTSDAPLIDLLQDGESYTIQTTSLGCFHSCKETFEIKQEARIYSVQCGDVSKTLTTITVNQIHDFEMKLQNLSGGLCTTKDSYILSFGSTEIHIIDDSCMFNGGHKLMRILGFEIPHDN